MNNNNENKLLNDVRKTLDDELERMDASLQSRLSLARNQALEMRTSKSYSIWHLSGVTVFASVATLVLTLWLQPVVNKSEPYDTGLVAETTDTLDSISEDFDILMAVEELDFFEELEFYEWLDAEYS